MQNLNKFFLTFAFLFLCSSLYAGSGTFQVSTITAPGNIYVDKNLIVSTLTATDSNGLWVTEDDGAGIFVQNGGNVGIGTSSPSADLEVNKAGGASIKATYPATLSFAPDSVMGHIKVTYNNLGTTAQGLYSLSGRGFYVCKITATDGDTCSFVLMSGVDVGYTYRFSCIAKANCTTTPSGGTLIVDIDGFGVNYIITMSGGTGGISLKASSSTSGTTVFELIYVVS